MLVKRIWRANSYLTISYKKKIENTFVTFISNQSLHCQFMYVLFQQCLTQNVWNLYSWLKTFGFLTSTMSVYSWRGGGVFIFDRKFWVVGQSLKPAFCCFQTICTRLLIHSSASWFTNCSIILGILGLGGPAENIMKLVIAVKLGNKELFCHRKIVSWCQMFLIANI